MKRKSTHDLVLASGGILEVVVHEVVRRCECCGTPLEYHTRKRTEKELAPEKQKLEAELRADVERNYGDGIGEKCAIVWEHFPSAGVQQPKAMRK